MHKFINMDWKKVCPSLTYIPRYAILEKCSVCHIYKAYYLNDDPDITCRGLEFYYSYINDNPLDYGKIEKLSCEEFQLYSVLA